MYAYFTVLQDHIHKTFAFVYIEFGCEHWAEEAVQVDVRRGNNLKLVQY